MGNNRGEIVPYDVRMGAIRQAMVVKLPTVKKLLPEHVRPERFMRVVLTAVQASPTLAECTPESILKSTLRAAMLGLSIDDGRGLAYLVPFHNNRARCKEAQLVVGYRGLALLARQSGNVGAVSACAVREGDDFHYDLATNELHHVKSRTPAYDKEHGEVRPVVAAWARATIVGHFGGQIVRDPQVVVLERWEIDRRRDGSKGYQNAVQYKTPNPWVDFYAEMAAKTAVRDLCKLLPLREDAGDALMLDNLHDRGEPQAWPEWDEPEAAAAASPAGKPQGKLVQLAAEEQARRDAEVQAQIAPLLAALALAADEGTIAEIERGVDPAVVPQAALDQIEQAIEARRAALAKPADDKPGKGK